MLKMFIKSALYYTLVRTYGRRLAFVLGNVLFIVFVNFVYTDIVEYLTLNDMKSSLVYALLVKWSLVLSSIGLIIYTVLSALKKNSLSNSESSDTKNSLTKVEQNVQDKDKLYSHADKLIDDMRADVTHTTINDIEDSLRAKDKLKSQGDKLIEEMKEKK